MIFEHIFNDQSGRVHDLNLMNGSWHFLSFCWLLPNAHPYRSYNLQCQPTDVCTSLKWRPSLVTSHRNAHIGVNFDLFKVGSFEVRGCIDWWQTLRPHIWYYHNFSLIAASETPLEAIYIVSSFRPKIRSILQLDPHTDFFDPACLGTNSFETQFFRLRSLG